MAHQDGVIPIRAGRNHVNGNTRHRFNTAQVQAGIFRQGIELRDTHGGIAPTLNGFINGFATFDFIGSQRQNVDDFARFSSKITIIPLT